MSLEIHIEHISILIFSDPLTADYPDVNRWTTTASHLPPSPAVGARTPTGAIALGPSTAALGEATP
jgi:hypothetical protein